MTITECDRIPRALRRGPAAEGRLGTMETVHNTVQGQLAAQQIYFPSKAAFAHPKADTEITPNMIPSVSQYTGQELLTGYQAEAYADHFIAQHIADMTGGKTYSQLSRGNGRRGARRSVRPDD